MSTDAPADDAVPRDPAYYRAGVHFAERVKNLADEHDRHLDGEVIETCIREGVATPQPDGRVYYRATLGGVTYRLVCSPRDHLAITGHPIAINTEAARESGRWSEQAIADIRAFLAAKAD